MRKIWVFLLAAIAFASSAVATLTYSVVTGSFASFRIGCELLSTAESAGLLERAQRTEVVDRVLREMRKSGSGAHPRGEEYIGQMRTGCSSPLNWQARR